MQEQRRESTELRREIAQLKSRQETVVVNIRFKEKEKELQKVQSELRQLIARTGGMKVDTKCCVVDN